MMYCRKPPKKPERKHSILQTNMSSTLNDLSKFFPEQINTLKKSETYILIRCRKTATSIPDFFYARFDNEVLYLWVNIFCNIRMKNFSFSFE